MATSLKGWRIFKITKEKKKREKEKVYICILGQILSIAILTKFK